MVMERRGEKTESSGMIAMLMERWGGKRWSRQTHLLVGLGVEGVAVEEWKEVKENGGKKENSRNRNTYEAIE